jgi:hypothetical protein
MKYFRGSWTVFILLSLICLAVFSFIRLLPSGRLTHATSSGPTTKVWLQTMDSCKQALDGASYVLVGGTTTLSASRKGNGVQSVGTGSGCPALGGNCAITQTGCLSFSVPVSGTQTYTVLQTLTPPKNSSNPGGYAPCQGGSACQSEEVDLTMNSAGLVQATVKNVYPSGYTAVWPNNDPNTGASYYTGTTTDPIVIHDFGLGSGSCDGDSDADDHLTGSASQYCAYPERSEASACQPFPWACNWTYSSSTGQYRMTSIP